MPSPIRLTEILIIKHLASNNTSIFRRTPSHITQASKIFHFPALAQAHNSWNCMLHREHGDNPLSLPLAYVLELAAVGDAVEDVTDRVNVCRNDINLCTADFSAATNAIPELVLLADVALDDNAVEFGATEVFEIADKVETEDEMTVVFETLDELE